MRRKILSLVTVLLIILVAPMNVSAASKNAVRIPQSAAEWASFSPKERAQTMAWIWDQARILNVADDLKAQAQRQSTAQTALLTTGGGISCGIAVNHQPWGSYSNGWAQAYTYSTVYALDTGVYNRNNGYWDTFYRNGRYVQSFGAAGGNTTVAYAQSIQDFKFAWETLTYSIQAYGTAEQLPGLFAFKLKPCFAALGV